MPLLVQCPPLRLSDGRNHLQPLHVGIAKRGCRHRDKQSQMEQSSHHLTRCLQTDTALQHHQTDDQRHIDIGQYERPVRQHIVQSRATRRLPRQSHDDRQHHGIAHHRNGGLIRRQEPQGVDLPSQQMYGNDDCHKQCQHDAIHRPGKRIPRHRSDTQLQCQSRHYQTSSDQEALFHSPRFIPQRAKARISCLCCRHLLRIRIQAASATAASASVPSAHALRHSGADGRSPHS